MLGGGGVRGEETENGGDMEGMPEFQAGPRNPEDWAGWDQQRGVAPVGHPGVNSPLPASPFWLTLPYFTADCSHGNWNKDELPAAGKVPGRHGRAAQRGAAVHPGWYGRWAHCTGPASAHPELAFQQHTDWGFGDGDVFVCFARGNVKLLSPRKCALPCGHRA